MNLSVELSKLTCDLEKTILILDSCDVGEGLASLLKKTSALGMIGFRQTIDWVDSALFIMAFIYNLAFENYFSSKKDYFKSFRRAINSMSEVPYKDFINHLDVDIQFD